MNYYVHKSNIDELLKILTIEEQKRLRNLVCSVDFPFEIIKYNKKNLSISLIQCPTWDALQEPIVGDSYCFNTDGTCRKIKGGTKVYHNKWEFVSKDYKGFDVERAKQRTKNWSKIPNINMLKSKIGNKSFWYKLLEENNLDI